MRPEDKIQVEEIAKKIQTLKGARAVWVYENAPNLAPLGNRSPAVKLYDAKALLKMIDEGVKGNESSREALLTVQKSEDPEYHTLIEAQSQATLKLSEMDSEIEYWERIFVLNTIETT
jgi:hypothetical protein